ncbi:hypothetical protein Bca4012_038810 [Brassica carinata]
MGLVLVFQLLIFSWDWVSSCSSLFVFNCSKFFSLSCVFPDSTATSIIHNLSSEVSFSDKRPNQMRDSL